MSWRGIRLILTTLLSCGWFAETFGMNDTGIAACATAAEYGLPCNDVTSGTAQFPGQDAEFGRDISASDESDGHAGFRLVKLSSQGEPLADQSADYDTMPWDCVRDEITGLTWEVKTNDDGLRDADWTFTWYDSSAPAIGVTQGYENGGTCSDDTHCDTEKFLLQVNADGLCGYSDWVLPDRDQLQGILNYGVSSFDPMMDLSYFPNSRRVHYWTSNTDALVGSSAWAGYYGSGSFLGRGKFNADAIRLVRGAPSSRMSRVPHSDPMASRASCDAALPESSPDSRFLVEEAMAIDLQTGLVWARCPEGTIWDDAGTPAWSDDQCQSQESTTAFSWQDALLHVQALNQEAAADLRMPNIKELSTLVELSCSFPSINERVFPDTGTSRYWSNSPEPAANGLTAWAVNFGNGSVSAYLVSARFQLRLLLGEIDPPSDVIMVADFEEGPGRR